MARYHDSNDHLKISKIAPVVLRMLVFDRIYLLYLSLCTLTECQAQIYRTIRHYRNFAKYLAKTKLKLLQKRRLGYILIMINSHFGNLISDSETPASASS